MLALLHALNYAQGLMTSHKKKKEKKKDLVTINDPSTKLSYVMSGGMMEMGNQTTLR